MVISGGNHDPALRLEAPGDLIEAFDIHTIGTMRRKDSALHVDAHLVPVPGPEGPNPGSASGPANRWWRERDRSGRSVIIPTGRHGYIGNREWAAGVRLLRNRDTQDHAVPPEALCCPLSASKSFRAPGDSEHAKALLCAHRESLRRHHADGVVRCLIALAIRRLLRCRRRRTGWRVARR